MSSLSERMVLSVVRQTLDEHFRSIPFHTFYHEIPEVSECLRVGGTCSEHVLSFQKLLATRGVESALHCASINGQMSHRLLRISTNDEVFFIDPGNAWPSVDLYPLTHNFFFSAYGHTFESRVESEVVIVSRAHSGQHRVMMTIPKLGQPQEEILRRIKSRFDPVGDYPFTDRLRVAYMIGDEFLYIREDVFHRYCKNGKHFMEKVINSTNLEAILKKHFNISPGDLGIAGPDWDKWRAKYERRVRREPQGDLLKKGTDDSIRNTLLTQVNSKRCGCF